ncbi:MAG TPA: flagellar basal body P-ring formation chaperone FlgA [Acidobacteriota bacterium]|nr:flagellar basal body P-ring formation chaperone FlgA [Acidobacteriota bacterium]
MTWPAPGLLLTAGAIVVTAAVAFASSGITIRLKEETALRSATASLGDVAEVSGNDQALVQMLEKTDLGSTPEFGGVRTLNRNQIREHVRAVTGYRIGNEFSGASAVKIRRKGKEVAEEEVAALLIAHLVEHTPWEKSEITITSINNLNGLEIPPGDSALMISPAGTIFGHGNLMAPLDIVHEGNHYRTLWITADVKINARIVSAARKIISGKPVASEDVRLTDAAVTDLRAAYFRQVDIVVGKVARRHFAPGDPLTAQAFVEPFLVNRGDMVRLRLERDGVALTSLVRAEENGRLGQVIRVKNFEFSSVLRARVSGQAQVVLQ